MFDHVEGKNNSWLNITPDILLGIVARLDHISRINVAIAYPGIFLRPGFNIFLQDAEQQLRRQEIQRLTPFPYIERHDMRALIYTAIEQDVDLPVIKDMLDTYKSICPTSIDGIWGEYLTAVRPPLAFAAVLGKPQIVSLLVDEGADPFLYSCRPNINDISSMIPHSCVLSGFVHARCQSDGLRMERSLCTTAMTGIFLLEIYPREPDGAIHMRREECAARLYIRGVPIPWGPEPEDGVPDITLYRQLANPVRARFLRLVKVILEPLIPDRGGDPEFNNLLLFALQTAVDFQAYDNNIEMIKYLVDIGAPLTAPGDQVYRTLAVDSANNGNLKTAKYLLDLYLERGLTFEDMGFIITKHEDTLALVQTLYRLLGRSSGRPAHIHHAELLTDAIYARDIPSVGWLIEQGAARPHHMALAIINEDIATLCYLLEGGMSPNDVLLDRNDEYNSWSPLEYAIVAASWPSVRILIQHGARPSSVSALCKAELLEVYEEMFGVDYATAKELVSPDVLRQEYYKAGRIEGDLHQAMYHFILQ
ncbi:hypothetical protein SAMD00023353_8600100 [Rosellinia necatrix]|uniref:Uncharacterized protein n=1 Tax=Rosellinia necatrix TaxID=77044 RepID=A0A1W2TVC4_ROSNE|nr:hypothetical protein SAMD00023353_8600100 [Rosellinia necatrix]